MRNHTHLLGLLGLLVCLCSSASASTDAVHYSVKKPQTYTPTKSILRDVKLTADEFDTIIGNTIDDGLDLIGNDD